MNRIRPVVLSSLLLALAAATARAEVKMPAIFGDHMILQEGQKIPLWGTAAPGEKIAITLGNPGANVEKATVTAGSDGKWRVDLPRVAESAAPVTLTVAGAQTLTFTDVLVGDVWLCSGQSNMEFGLGAINTQLNQPAAEAAKPDWRNDPQLRLFRVARKSTLDPVDDVAGKWELCTPASSATFSAVAYFTARDLRARFHRPIGLIASYWGGTPAEAWTSLSALQANPALATYVASYDKTRADLPQATAEYPAKMAAYQKQLDAWTSAHGAAYDAEVKAWEAAAAAAKAKGAPEPPPPNKPAMPPVPRAPDGGGHAPADLYNGMIAPLIPYGIKGVLWYQGESNQGAPGIYATLFPTMIQDWRTRWAQGDFPFVFVLLAGFDNHNNWAWLRESQLAALKLPHTAMVSAADIGNPKNIHPTDKWDVGQRMARAVRRLAYGEKVVAAGPTYESMKIEGTSVHLHYADIGSGLVMAAPPWVAPGVQPPPTDHLIGFAVAGEDKKWAPAEARIEGAEVVVSSPAVPKPVAIRYGWENVPVGNLYNKEGLPATPFRTDDWPEPTTAPVP